LLLTQQRIPLHDIISLLDNPPDCCRVTADLLQSRYPFEIGTFFYMIISPYYRFVFIAVPKTGTTSIEQALSNVLSEQCPHKFYAKVTACRTYQFIFRNLSQLHMPLPPPYVLPVSYKHEARSLLSCIKPQSTASYTTVAFVRNPWDRLVSQYKQFKRPHFLHHENRRKLHEASLVSFEAFVQQYKEDPRPMWKFLVDTEGALSIDHIGRFENLESDFTDICKKLSMPAIKLDHLNPAKGKTKSYQEYYSSQLLEEISPILAKDAELFGYSFSGVL